MIRRAIIICALGYFIDVFDIQLFTVLRVPSLMDIGVAPDRLASVGGFIFGAQMFGMVLGGFVWGWLGDRVGRTKALYGSILIYSLGTLVCSFVHDPVVYGLLRFVTGFGLSGEVGAAVVLVAELMSPKERGWGIIIIGGIGYLGPACAVLTAFLLDWRQTYIAAGILGLLLLALRTRLAESSLFQRIDHHQSLGDFWKLFARPKAFTTLVCCLLMASPAIFAWSLLNFFSMEFGRAVLTPDSSFNQKTCLFIFFLGASCGDVLSGVTTQFLQSRRKAMTAALLAGAIASAIYLLAMPEIKVSTTTLYITYFILGAASGFWALATLMTSEHFGTNVRATSAIVMLNLLRGLTIPIIFAFQQLQGLTTSVHAAALIGFVSYAAAFLALRHLRETHGLDLDYVQRPE